VLHSLSLDAAFRVGGSLGSKRAIGYFDAALGDASRGAEIFKDGGYGQSSQPRTP
jgi:hypothetical protein